MLTNVQDTSLDAFYDLKQGHKLQDQEIKILNVMKPGVLYTRKELSKMTAIETSSISARINGMLDIQVVVDGKKKCSVTSKNVQAVRLK